MGTTYCIIWLMSSSFWHLFLLKLANPTIIIIMVDEAFHFWKMTLFMTFKYLHWIIVRWLLMISKFSRFLYLRFVDLF